MNFIRRTAVFLILLAIFVIALVAASQNSGMVSLVFLDWSTWKWPVSWWVLSAFVVGIIVGITLNLVSNTRLRMHASKANRALKQSHSELDKMRAEA